MSKVKKQRIRYHTTKKIKIPSMTPKKKEYRGSSAGIKNVRATLSHTFTTAYAGYTQTDSDFAIVVFGLWWMFSYCLWLDGKTRNIKRQRATENRTVPSTCNRDQILRYNTTHQQTEKNERKVEAPWFCSQKKTELSIEECI